MWPVLILVKGQVEDGNVHKSFLLGEDAYGFVFVYLGLIVLRFSEGTSVSFFSNMEKQCGSIFKGVELSIKNVGFAIV